MGDNRWNVLEQELCTPYYITWPNDLTKQPFEAFFFNHLLCCRNRTGSFNRVADDLLDSFEVSIIDHTWSQRSHLMTSFNI